MKKFFCFCFLITLSCNSDSKQHNTQPADNEKTNLFSDANILGKWKFDSIAEDGVIVKVFSPVDDALGYEFNSNTNLYLIKKKNIEESQFLGKYILTTDSIFFQTEKGSIFMRFEYSFDNDQLKLDGNFPISEANRSKPTFFLSIWKRSTTDSVPSGKK